MVTAVPLISQNTLSQSIARTIRPCESLDAETSLARASEAFRDFGRTILPVTSFGLYVGALKEVVILDAIGRGASGSEPIRSLIAQDERTLLPNATGAEALRAFSDTGQDTLLVVSADLRPLGSLSPSDLLSTRVRRLRPKPIGGMATPLGVYLSNGVIRAGANGWGLVLTGALLFSLLLCADMAATFAVNGALKFGLPESWLDFAGGATSLCLFMAGLRLLPLAGTHAAEHMVVHAIERGEDLTPEVVSRMPRVHPRCGTNIAAGAGIFLGVFGWNWSDDNQLRFLVAALATLFFWRPLGYFLQQFITTKPPSRKQLQDGIRAGKELIDRYESNPVISTSPVQRLLNSGVLHIIVGSTITAGLLQLLAKVLGFDDWLRVYF